MNYSNLFDTPEIEGKVITVSSLGLLHAPTGQIVVCDPLASSLSDVKSLEKTIPSGDYEVKVSSVDMPGLRHAAAKLVITKNKPVRWESAYADESQGLVVDAGLGCFCDAETATRYKAFEDDFLTKNPGANMYDDYFAAKFKENAIDKSDPMDIGNWLNFKLPNSEEHNIVMFNSGYGDGTYPCYWGIDSNDEICELIVDFKIFDSNFE